MININTLACITLPIGLVTNCLADRQSYLPDLHDGTVSFYLDNDVFRGTDRDYTNGWRLAWSSGERKKLADISPIQRKLNKLSGGDGSNDFFDDIWGFNDPANISYQYGMAITQQMFTPNTFEGLRPPRERPYAGWIGVGFSLHVADERAINSVEFSFGTVGPNAFAEETQDFVHQIIGEEEFDDWDSQIPNEFTFNINLNQKRRYTYVEKDDFPLLPFSINGFTEAGVSLGNYLTAASAGWMVQLGYNVPVDFSDPRLSPTANAISWHDTEVKPKFSAYLLGGIRGRAVLHDITLDGPLFRDFDTGTSSEPFQLEYYYGFGLRYKNIEMSYINTTRTREYKSQEDSQDFGSIVVRISY